MTQFSLLHVSLVPGSLILLLKKLHHKTKLILCSIIVRYKDSNIIIFSQIAKYNICIAGTHHLLARLIPKLSDPALLN